LVERYLIMKTEAEKKASREYWSIFWSRENLLVSVLLSFFLSVVVQLVYYGKPLWTLNVAECWDIGLTTLVSTLALGLFTAVFLAVPKYCIERSLAIENSIGEKLSAFTQEVENSIDKKLSAFTQEVENQLKKIDKIDNCPKMTAMYTPDDTFKNRIEHLAKDLSPSQKWIYANYISRLLSEYFKSPSLSVSPNDYTKLTAKCIEEAKLSVQMWSAMKLHVWLAHNLVDDAQKSRKNFFNNIGNVEQFDVASHSHIALLRQRPNTITRQRLVYLSHDDLKYMFMFERHLDAFHRINNLEGVITEFFTGDVADVILQLPETDYALYDSKTLLEWSNSELSLSSSDFKNDSEKISLFENFFSTATRHAYVELKKSIIDKKIAQLDKILLTKTLPHKLCYLYQSVPGFTEGRGVFRNFDAPEWSSIFTSRRSALQMGLALCMPTIEQNNTNAQQGEQINIVEIGPEKGSHISTICDEFGTNFIQEYTLIDISPSLLTHAKAALDNRFYDFPNVHRNIRQLDCCNVQDASDLCDVVTNKHVIISANGTLFGKNSDFRIEDFSNALDIFVTLDIYDVDKTYEKYMQTKVWLLQPLRIFEIPIVDSILDKFQDILFTPNYSDDNFQILFNLKMYIGILTDTITYENFGDYSEKSCFSWDKYKETLYFVDFSSYNKEEILLFPEAIEQGTISEKEKEYRQKRDEFFTTIKDLIILSSLKFCDTLNSDGRAALSAAGKAKTYFENKGFEVQKCDCATDDFIYLLLKRNNVNANND